MIVTIVTTMKSGTKEEFELFARYQLYVPLLRYIVVPADKVLR